MSVPLATVIGFAALVLAAWSVVLVVRDRWIDRTQLLGLAVLESAILVQTVIAAVALAGGDRPTELVVFIGYLASSVLLLPAAVSLTLLERTRWGSVIVLAGFVITAVLQLRLLQLWRM